MAEVGGRQYSFVRMVAQIHTRRRQEARLNGVDRQLLPPSRDQYGVDWSVKVTRAGVSVDRYVIYGLSRAETEAFLRARGCASGLGTFGAALARLDARPFRVMVGVDGARTKLYGDLEDDDPGMICVDMWRDRPSTVRTYRRFGPSGREAALAACAPELRTELAWLLQQPPFDTETPFHFALQLSGGSGPCTGADLGFAPDWEALAGRDPALQRRELVYAMLDRHGLAAHYPAVEAALWSGPLGVTNYVGFRMAPGGGFAVNVYAVLNTVVARDGQLVQMDVSGQGFRARPLRVCFALSEAPQLVFRMRGPDDRPAWSQVGAWALEHSVPSADEAGKLSDGGLFGRAAELAAVASFHGTPASPLGALRSLRGAPGVQRAWLEPDGTGDARTYGLAQND